MTGAILKRLLFALILVCSVSMKLAVFALVNAAVVVDSKTGKEICSYNADERIQPASLTKMMTLLLTFEALDRKKIRLNDRVKISKKANAQKPCRLGLKCGQKILVRDAILALITKSANDIAVALAEHIGRTEENFVRMMNKKAKALGMKSTVFYNPSGWKNKKQLTTVRDMAKLSRALITRYPSYYHLFATKQFRYENKVMRNHNLLLGKHNGYTVDGIKTGFVTASGYNLAASATNGKTRLVAVVLGGRTRQHRDEQVSMLLAKCFSKIAQRKSLKRRSIYSSFRSSSFYSPRGAGIYNKLRMQ